MFKFRRMSARIALYAGALILIIAVGPWRSRPITTAQLLS